MKAGYSHTTVELIHIPYLSIPKYWHKEHDQFMEDEISIGVDGNIDSTDPLTFHFASAYDGGQGLRNINFTMLDEDAKALADGINLILSKRHSDL